MKIKDVMNAGYAQIDPGATLREAARQFSDPPGRHPQVGGGGGAVGGLPLGGGPNPAALPRYEEILRDGGSMSDALEMFIDRGRELADKPILPHVIKDAITLSPDDPLL